MSSEEQLFHEITDRLSQQTQGVAAGTMMRAPAIRYRDEAFAFLYKEGHMVFKLGKTFSANEPIIPFNPFKKKGPLPGWYQVPSEMKQMWPDFADQALERLISS